jgi:hypothetical protein
VTRTCVASAERSAGPRVSAHANSVTHTRTDAAALVGAAVRRRAVPTLPRDAGTSTSAKTTKESQVKKQERAFNGHSQSCKSPAAGGHARLGSRRWSARTEEKESHAMYRLLARSKAKRKMVKT